MMFEEIEKAIAEVQQPRSQFQLEKFVLGQHSTPEMQYYQTCIELQDMIFKYKTAQIELQIQQKKFEKLVAKGDEVSALKAKKLELGMQQTKVAMLGAEREINHLVNIWNSFEIKFTREQIEAGQFDYWKARLTGNAKAMLIGGVSVNPAHIEAMQQAGVLDEFVIEVQSSKKELGL
jgi:hypothetical protein